VHKKFERLDFQKSMVVFMASGLISVNALAADLYVSPNGSDSATGTQAAPFRTISKAASVAAAGTTVHVAPGTYNGNVSTPKSGTASAPIRYVSDSTWGAKIIGTGTEFHWNNNGSYVQIVGFDISGPGRGGILNMGSHTLIASNHVHNLTVSGGCTGSGGAGIVNANYQATDCDIIGNVVHDVGVPGACNGVQGIYHSLLRGKIANNLSYRNSSFGIHLWHAANETTIVNNTVFNNGSSSMGGGIVVGRGDSGAGVMNNTLILNNIVYNNPSSGISQYCYSGDNCIGTGNVVANNLVYGSRTAISLKVGSATGTIAADPQFVNYQASGLGDYHLRSTSPAIDKGQTAYAPTTDLSNVARPQGNGIDIGAYEFVSPTPAPAPDIKLSLSATSLIPGQAFTVTVSGITPSTYANDYVALYLASATDAQWSYDGQVIDVSGTLTFNFKAPVNPGVYNIRLFGESNAQNRLAVSANITVAQAPAPVIQLSSNALSFGWVKVGKSSTIQYVTIKNTGNAALNFISSTLSGDFAYGNLGTCTKSLVAGSSCTYSVKFTPKTKGSRIGSLVINTNAPVNGVIKIGLSGSGY
jgi:hypothetical protein